MLFWQCYIKAQIKYIYQTLIEVIMSIGFIGNSQQHESRVENDYDYNSNVTPEYTHLDKVSDGCWERWDIDLLIDQIKNDAINFLHFHEIPYADTLLGDIGCLLYTSDAADE